MPPDGDAEESAETVKSYNLHVSSRYLDLTRRKLELTRLPHGPDLQDDREWKYGTPKSLLEPNIDYWLEQYDWRRRESHFNAALPQYRTAITPSSSPSLRLHFVHKRSPSSTAIPLLYCHGWPGGVLEVRKIIDKLTTPTNEGEPAFHVVVPSIPGCGFSDAASPEKMRMKGVAEIFDLLMRRLGYKYYVAHGMDWGFDICRMLAIHHSSRCLAIHTITPLPYLRPPSLIYRPAQYLRFLIARLIPSRAMTLRLGYRSTDFHSLPKWRGTTSEGINSASLGLRFGLRAKPHTLAYALCDSPAGLLAWTRELLHSRTDLAEAFSLEDAIDFTMMSWLPGPEMPLRYLAASLTDPAELREAKERWTSTPLGISDFPSSKSGFPPPWAACLQPLVWMRRHEGTKIGWPVWERPNELAEDLKAFFGEVIMRRDARLRESCVAGLDSVE